MMITLPGLAAEALGSFLADDMKDRFGVSHARLAEIVNVFGQQHFDLHSRSPPITSQTPLSAA